jgi:N-acetylmuramoyl-L-alanine amidase
MITRNFLWGMVTFAAAAHPAAPTELRNIELVSDGGVTHIALALSGSAPQKVFTLAAPARVVVDLRHTRMHAGVRPPPGTGIVAGIRTGPRSDGTLRVVIELKSMVSEHSHWLARPPGPQQELVIDLGETPRAKSASLDPQQPRAAPLPPPVALQTGAPEPAASPPSLLASAPSKSAASQTAVLSPVSVQPVRALHAPLDTDRPIVVAVDAGHGGDDPGAIGHGGTREKDVTLAIASALAQRINEEPGMRAVLTRNRDEFIELKDRIRRAQDAKADLFVSVHADSIRDASIAGASVYVLSERGATDEAARWLADRENSADRMGGVPLAGKDPQLDSVLIDLSQTATISASMIAAERVLLALDSVGEVRKPRVQQAGFYVLKSRAMASMLVETAYISNPQEERRLRTGAQQGKLANAIFTGIRTFFAANPPPGTRFAQLRRGLARLAPESPRLP